MSQKPLNAREIEEIRNHLECTADIMVKTYSIKQLCNLDGVSSYIVKQSGKYIPVRIDHSYARAFYNRGAKSRPYTVKRLRVDEIKHIFNKRNGSYKLEETLK